MSAFIAYTTSQSDTDIVIPTGTVEGDLLVFLSGSEFDRNQNLPGWDQISSSGIGFGTYLAYKWATYNDIFTSTVDLTGAGAGGTYVSNVLMSFSRAGLGGTITNGSRDTLDTWSVLNPTGGSTGTVDSSGGAFITASPATSAWGLCISMGWVQSGGGFNGVLDSFSVTTTAGYSTIVPLYNPGIGGFSFSTWVTIGEETSYIQREWTGSIEGNKIQGHHIRWAPGLTLSSGGGAGDSWGWTG